MSAPVLPPITTRRISRSNSTSSSIHTARNTGSRQGHRTSFQYKRPTSSASIEQHFETLDAAVENRPVEDLKQVRHNLKRVSRSNRTSLSGIESSLLRSLRPTREMKFESPNVRPALLPVRSATQPINAPTSKSTADDTTQSLSPRNRTPDPGQDLIRSITRDAPSSVAVVDHQRGVTKLGQNVQAIALQYTTQTPRPRTSRENKLGNALYQATNSSHISLQQRPTTTRPKRDRSAHGSKDTVNGSSVSSLQSEQSRGRGHRSPAQKEMLSQALSKANIAVELDNAQNIPGAIQAYVEACDILDLVMRQSHDKDDKRKLNAIRTTYSNRIAELYDLDSSFDHLKDKDLPESPRLPEGILMAEEQEEEEEHEHEVYEPDNSQLSADATDEQRPTLQLPPRQESLLPQIFGGAEYIHPHQSSLRSLQPKENLGVPMDTRYAPPPLSPRRPLSPYADDGQKTPVVASHPEDALQPHGSSNNTSWLCTVDENASSGRSSIRSLAEDDAQDEQLVSAIEAGFDAMNAAVDAAYEADVVPDLKSQSNDGTTATASTSTNMPLTGRGTNRTLSSQVSISTFDSYNTETRYDPLTGEYLNDTARDEEELLDRILQDHHAMESGSTVVSALPRQSDSSGFSARSSGRTWDSALTSNTNATAATSHTTLSTLAEGPEMSLTPKKDRDFRHIDQTPGMEVTAGRQSAAPPPPLPVAENYASLRDRRVSSQGTADLKIGTSTDISRSMTLTDASTTTLPLTPITLVTSFDTARPESAGDSTLARTVSQDGSSVAEKTVKPSRTSDILEFKPRGKKLSLTTSDLHDRPLTPGSSVYPPKSSAGTSSAVSPLVPIIATNTVGGGMYLFDSISKPPPRSQLATTTDSNEPLPLEPCPESFLLRPFWLMRTLYQALAHPRGGWLSNKLFVPRDIWRVRNVKLKALDDKVAQLDLLTAALLKLSKVDTLDADAVWEELQSFETIIEQARIALQKKLGSDVGLSGSSGMLRAPTGVLDEHESRSSSKSFVSSWRKLRSKPSAPALGPQPSAHASHPSQLTMISLPMTSVSSVPTSRSGHNNHQRLQTRQPPPTPTTLQPHIPAPNAIYMASLARLFDAAQVLDSIARQVEDPGLKATSKTHVGLEISMRNAAEFFAFFVVRFVLADINLLIDKYLKRGGEWVML